MRTRPDKAFAYMVDTIEEIGHGLLSGEYSACSTTKRVNDRLMRRLIQKNNNQDARVRATDRLGKIESISGLPGELSANYHQARTVRLQIKQDIGRCNGRSAAISLPCESIREQIAAH
jgi:hypothetical protein